MPVHLCSVNEHYVYRGGSAQGPHSHILMTGEGGSTEVHILYPKNPNFRIYLPKKSLLF